MMDENLRKLVHMVFGLGIAVLVAFVDREVLLPLLAGAVLGGLMVSDAIARGYRVPFISPLVDRLERKDVIPGQGALFFTISVLICLIFFSKESVFFAVVVLSVLDGAATIAGKAWGRTRIFRGKSLEGSLVGVVLAIMVLVWFLPWVKGFQIALFAGLVELISPVDDNLTIPGAICLLLEFL